MLLPLFSYCYWYSSVTPWKWVFLLLLLSFTLVPLSIHGGFCFSFTCWYLFGILCSASDVAATASFVTWHLFLHTPTTQLHSTPPLCLSLNATAHADTLLGLLGLAGPISHTGSRGVHSLIHSLIHLILAQFAFHSTWASAPLHSLIHPLLLLLFTYWCCCLHCHHTACYVHRGRARVSSSSDVQQDLNCEPRIYILPEKYKCFPSTTIRREAAGKRERERETLNCWL